MILFSCSCQKLTDAIKHSDISCTSELLIIHLKWFDTLQYVHRYCIANDAYMISTFLVIYSFQQVGRQITKNNEMVQYPEELTISNGVSYVWMTLSTIIIVKEL